MRSYSKLQRISFMFQCTFTGGKCAGCSQLTRMLHMLQHVPMLPHWGRCTVCSYLTRMLYILYFSMFQCSLTGGGVRYVHSSQECYIYYTSACSNALSLGAVYGVFIAHKNVIYIILQHVPMLPHWGRCTVYVMFIAHKNVIYIMLQHVPMLSHLGRCTVCS